MAKVLEIVEWQIRFWKKIKIDLEDEELKAMVMQCYLSDMVWEEFRVEEEDIVKVEGLGECKEYEKRI